MTQLRETSKDSCGVLESTEQTVGSQYGFGREERSEAVLLRNPNPVEVIRLDERAVRRLIMVPSWETVTFAQVEGGQDLMEACSIQRGHSDGVCAKS